MDSALRHDPEVVFTRSTGQPGTCKRAGTMVEVEFDPQNFYKLLDTPGCSLRRWR